MIQEYRSIVEPVEFRSADAGRIVASGIAMRYGAKSKPIPFRGRGIAREVFQPGAFAKTIQESDVAAHNEHRGPYLGRMGAGSLRLMDGRSELGYEIDLPDTTAGRDTAYLLERGDIKGSSIGFVALPGKSSWSVDSDNLGLRSITEARLFRVDLTTNPVYDESTAEMALRSLAEVEHLDIDDVYAAAETGDWRSLLDREVGGEHEEQDDGRVTPTVRPRLLHLYA